MARSDHHHIDLDNRLKICIKQVLIYGTVIICLSPGYNGKDSKLIMNYINLVSDYFYAVVILTHAQTTHREGVIVMFIGKEEVGLPKHSQPIISQNPLHFLF